MWQNLDENTKKILKYFIGITIQFLAIAVPILWFLWQTSVARSVKLATIESQIMSIYQNKADTQTVETVIDSLQRIDSDMETLINFTLKTYTQNVVCEKLTPPKFKRE